MIAIRKIVTTSIQMLTTDCERGNRVYVNFRAKYFKWKAKPHTSSEKNSIHGILLQVSKYKACKTN